MNGEKKKWMNSVRIGLVDESVLVSMVQIRIILYSLIVLLIIVLLLLFSRRDDLYGGNVR